jgi:hypothetical protein
MTGVPWSVDFDDAIRDTFRLADTTGSIAQRPLDSP